MPPPQRELDKTQWCQRALLMYREMEVHYTKYFLVQLMRNSGLLRNNCVGKLFIPAERTDSHIKYNFQYLPPPPPLHRSETQFILYFSVALQMRPFCIFHLIKVKVVRRITETETNKRTRFSCSDQLSPKTYSSALNRRVRRHLGKGRREGHNDEQRDRRRVSIANQNRSIDCLQYPKYLQFYQSIYCNA